MKHTNLAIAIAIALAPAALPAATPAPAEQNAAQLSEVVVTAQRREQDLQKTPVSVSAYTAEDLEAAQIVNGNDVILASPGVVGGRQIANSNAATYFIRGVGQDDANTLVDPAVGVYVDDVYIARQIANNNFLYDVERIEVLRGPQGVLYGRNTSGGAVKIVTKKPEAEWGGSLEAGFGNYNAWELRGVLNAPLSDSFYSRTAMFTQQRDGFIRNVTLNERSDDLDAWGVRQQLRMLGGDNLTVDVNGSFTQSNTVGTTSSNRLISGDDLFVTQSGYLNPRNVVQEARADVTAELRGETYTFKSVSAFANTKWDFALDFGGAPLPIYVIANEIKSRQFSQEFQLNKSFAGDRVNLTAGVFAFTEKSDNGELTELFGGAVRLLKNYSHNTNAYALYGQAQFKATDRLAFTVGGRFTKEDRDITIDQFIFDPGAGAFVSLWNDATLDALGIAREISDNDFSPKFGIEYQHSDDLFLYGSYTQGFKSASWNQRANAPSEFRPFKPEQVKAYEVGAKTYFLDRRVSLNAALFLNDYTDFIVNQINPTTGDFLTTNAAEMRVTGIELEAAAKVLPSVDLTASLAYMDAEYTKLAPGVPFPKSNEPKFTPKWSSTVGLRWTMWNGSAGDLRFNADYVYQSRYFVGLQNFESEHAYVLNLFNAGLSFTTGDERWTGSVYCQNCSNEEYFTTALAAAALGFETQIAAPPRTYGARLRYSFK